MYATDDEVKRVDINPYRRMNATNPYNKDFCEFLFI